jgi:membrane protease YdiL (CAAX protease family)
MVQIVFIYVGLLPDIILLVVGYVTDSILDILPYMAILNCSVGVILYALTPLVIDPMGVKASKPSREEAVGNVNQAKKDFTWIGCGAIVMILGTILAQIGVSLLADHICPEVLNTSYGTWLLTFLPEYLIAFPIGVFLICRVKNRGLSKAKEAPLGYGNTLKAIPALAFMLLSGSLVGGGLNLLFRKLLDKGGGNPVVSLIADDSILLRVIFMAVLAPIIEEFIFRKVLIDRLRPYGDLLAVVTSALIFGLIHGNLSQILPPHTLACGSRRGRGPQGRRAAGLVARVHVRLVVVADVEDAVTALEGAGHGLQANVDRGSIARESEDGGVVVAFGVQCRTNACCTCRRVLEVALITGDLNVRLGTKAREKGGASGRDDDNHVIPEHLERVAHH